MYQALRSRGVPTVLVVYPGENHGLTVPSYLRDRIARNLAWYDRFLGDRAAAGRADPSAATTGQAPR
jgi:dipeptidyl aminopeptidase/acylaminoacyl peptidase